MAIDVLEMVSRHEGADEVGAIGFGDMQLDVSGVDVGAGGGRNALGGGRGGAARGGAAGERGYLGDVVVG